MNKNFTEIYEMRGHGYCDSCGYGFERCLTDGKAFCMSAGIKPLDSQKEVQDVEKESV